jgi:hypothetical protein
MSLAGTTGGQLPAPPDFYNAALRNDPLPQLETKKAVPLGRWGALQEAGQGNGKPHGLAAMTRLEVWYKSTAPEATTAWLAVGCIKGGSSVINRMEHPKCQGIPPAPARQKTTTWKERIHPPVGRCTWPA